MPWRQRISKSRLLQGAPIPWRAVHTLRRSSSPQPHSTPEMFPCQSAIGATNVLVAE